MSYCISPGYFKTSYKKDSIYYHACNSPQYLIYFDPETFDQSEFPKPPLGIVVKEYRITTWGSMKINVSTTFFQKHIKLTKISNEEAFMELL